VKQDTLYQGILVAVAVAAAVLAPSASRAAPDKTVDAYIADIKGTDLTVRQDATNAIVEHGAAAVPALAKLLTDGDHSVARSGRIALERMAMHASGQPEAGAIAVALIDAMKATSDPRAARFLCREIRFVGDESTAEALAPLLKDKTLRERVRWTLVRMPTPAAAQVLREAMPTADPAFRVALLAALGAKADAEAIPLIAEQLEASDEDVQRAAVEALGRIPTAESLTRLTEARRGGTTVVRDASRAAIIEVASRLIQDDETRDLALRALRAELTDKPQGSDLCAILYALGRRLDGETAYMIIDYLDNDDAPVRAAAVDALQGYEPTPQAVRVLCKELDAAKTTGARAAYVEVLGACGAGAALPTIEAQTNDPDATVRRAAIEAIGAIGGGDGALALLRVAKRFGPDDADRVAALRALCRLKGDDVRGVLIESVGSPDANVRTLVATALGYQTGPEALQRLMAVAKNDKVPQVRVAAYEALGVLNVPEALPALLEGADSNDEAVRQAAAGAMKRLQGDTATGLMLATYSHASAAQRVALLNALAYRRNDRVPTLLREAINADDADIRAAAAAGLSMREESQDADRLLAAAKRGPEPVTNAALPGYLAIARNTEATDKRAALAMYTSALDLAKGAEHARGALEGIDRTAGAEDTALLAKIRPWLAAGPAQKAAAHAAIRIAVHLGNDRKDDAIAILKAALDTGPDRDAANRALIALRERGVDIDPGREHGFITQWWLIGPFPSEQLGLFDVALFPEQGVDLQAGGEYDGKHYDWKAYYTPDVNGIVDLNAAIGRYSNVGAYGYAELDVAQACDVTLKIGSDDAIVVWVNGERVHGANVNRGLVVDQDQAKAKLQAGRNRVLVKVLNGASAWEYCVRLVGTDGKPVVFTQPATK
jgi:HEAT repeat protein